MDEQVKELIEGVKKAIQTEADGYQFYKIAAERTKDPSGRDALLLLAEEELKHMEFLKGQFESLMETGNVDTSLSLGEQHDFSSGPIFSNELINRIGEAQFEMSVLSIGIQLELNSMNYYKSQAEQVSDPEVRKFYTELAGWEAVHYNALNKQMEMLKEDFWAAGGFAPF